MNHGVLIISIFGFHNVQQDAVFVIHKTLPNVSSGKQLLKTGILILYYHLETG
jgi:hypothetical protein